MDTARMTMEQFEQTIIEKELWSIVAKSYVLDAERRAILSNTAIVSSGGDVRGMVFQREGSVIAAKLISDLRLHAPQIEDPITYASEILAPIWEEDGV